MTPAKTKPETKLAQRSATKAAGKGNDASQGANAQQQQAAAEPGIVIVEGQRMVRAPAGFLIPESQFLAMTQPPREPPRPPAPIASPAQQRLRKMIDAIEAVIETEPNGTGRRRKIDPIFLQEAVDRMKAGADRPDPMPHVGALTSVHVAVAVELGAEWIARGKALGWAPKEGENRAVSAVAEWVGKFHPEQAAKVAAQPGLVGNAVRAWARGSGRPTKGEYRGSKWDTVAELCKVAGIRDHEPETIKKAWQRSEHK